MAVEHLVHRVAGLRPRNGSICGVTISPGLIELARIPCGAPEAARWRVIASTPPLAAPWADCSMKVAPRCADTEAVLMIAPPPRAMRCGQAARVTVKMRSSSLCRVNRQSSQLISANGPTRGADALL